MLRTDFCSRPAWAVLLAGGLLGLGLTGCGGSSSPARTSTATSTAAAPSPGAPAGSSVSTGPVHGTLTGQNHHPVANRNWKYVVHVTDAHGQPLSGTLDTAFVFGGAVVGRDTPPTHSFSHGRFAEDLKFPARAAGYPLELQVVVHAKGASVKLHWPVTVHK